MSCMRRCHVKNHVCLYVGQSLTVKQSLRRPHRRMHVLLRVLEALVAAPAVLFADSGV
jgi:hypothetical protein